MPDRLGSFRANQPLRINGLDTEITPESDDTIQVATTPPGQSQQTDVVIGLGPDPTVARTILFSIRAA
jgi:hypothetical protein